MSLQHGLRTLVLVCLLCPSGIAAAEAIHTTAVPPPTTEASVARVSAGQAKAYEQVLTEFDVALAAAPDDAALAVGRCRFIAWFADEDYEWVERASADLETCAEQLEARWPDDPHVRLFDLDQRWGQDAIEFGEPWLDDAKTWPTDLRRQLLTKLSQSYGTQDKTGRGGELAVQAARLGEPARVAAAVEWLVAAGESDRAHALLRDASPATDAWMAAQRVRAALELPDRSAALAELRRYAAADFEVAAAVVAKACLRAGDIACARESLEDAGEGSGSEELKQVRFDVAIAGSDMQAAANAVDFAGSEGFAPAIQRFAVVLGHAPGMLFTGTMPFAAIGFLFALSLIALVPGLALLPIHYRGLGRFVHGKPATPLFERIGLRQAWLAGAIVLCLPMLVAVAVAPGSLATLFDGEGMPDRDDLLRLTLWSSVAGLLLLAPIAWRLGLRRLVGDRAIWRNCWWRVLLAWLVLGIITIVIARFHGHADTSTMQTKMVESLVDGGIERFGAPLVLLLLAVLVPIYEELVFRGFLLGGMTKHISFGWANIIQAVLFALVHDDSPRFVFYLSLGLLSGWLVRKSRSLGPSIALHSANNALATLLRITVA